MISSWSKILLLGSDYFVLALLVLLTALLLSLIFSKPQKENRLSFLFSWLWKGALLAVLLAGAFFYLLDWVLFFDHRIFINRNILKLIACDFKALLDHAWSIDPLRTVTGFLSSVLAVLFLLFRWKKIPFRDRPDRRRRFLIVLAAAFGICLALFVYSQILYLKPPSDREHATFRKKLKGGTGPVLSLTVEFLTEPFLDRFEHFRNDFDLYRSSVSFSEILDRKWCQKNCRDWDQFKAREMPIVGMEQYLKTFNPEDMNRYNVILLLVESLRADQLRIFGGERVVMPFLESLAERAYLFTNTYAQASNSSYSDPACLSSHYPLRMRTYYRYPEQILYPRVLIYDVLKALNYRTAIISSQNENWGGMSNYFNTGSLDKFLHAANYKGETYNSNVSTPLNQQGKIDDRDTVREAVHWIDSLKGKEPFFIYMNLQNSHVPYRLPDDYPRRFSPSKLDFTIGFNSFPPKKAALVKGVYADSLGYVDQRIEEFVSYLEKTGQMEKTILVISGDTGQAFYEHGFAGHSNKLYNELLKVPLIIKVPGDKPESANDRLAQHIDIPPTVFHLLNIPAHPGFQGLNLFDPELRPDRAAYSVVQSYVHQYAIIQGPWKLIFDAGEWESSLYDLQKDPGERTDLKNREPDLVNKLSCKLAFWRFQQLDYYAQSGRYLNYYPPKFED